jgi:hypothetical protein
MCNIPDYQTRAMPESFLGNQRKTPNPDISFLVFRFYDILTFEYKIGKLHIIITILQIS